MPNSTRLAALLLLGCSAAAEPSPPAGYPSAMATNSCGPTDGPAVQLYLTPMPSDSAEPDAGTPFVRVVVWRPVEDLVGAIVDLGPASDQGFVSACSSSGECEAASSAQVQLGMNRGRNSLAGLVELEFPAAGRVRGSFRAPWRPRRTLCG